MPLLIFPLKPEGAALRLMPGGYLPPASTPEAAHAMANTAMPDAVLTLEIELDAIADSPSNEAAGLGLAACRGGLLRFLDRAPADPLP